MKYNYKIIVDSCLKIKDEYLNDERFTFITRSFEAIKSACPSPAAYMNAYKTEAEHIYVVTPSLSSSESYESALTAANDYEDGTGRELNIHIVDSSEEGRNIVDIINEIISLESLGLSFDEIVANIEVLKNTFFNKFSSEAALA